MFVIAAPHIYYFKDTDGDNVADVREIVYSGFSRNNVQGLPNNLKWSLDNHIYAAQWKKDQFLWDHEESDDVHSLAWTDGVLVFATRGDPPGWRRRVREERDVCRGGRVFLDHAGAEPKELRHGEQSHCLPGVSWAPATRDELGDQLGLPTHRCQQP